MKNLPQAFGNVTRIKILACLRDNDNKNVGDLIKNCNLSQSALSQHLKKLKDLGVVDSKLQGRERIYHLKYRQAGNISKKILNLIKK